MVPAPGSERNVRVPVGVLLQQTGDDGQAGGTTGLTASTRNGTRARRSWVSESGSPSPNGGAPVPHS